MTQVGFVYGCWLATGLVVSGCVQEGCPESVAPGVYVIDADTKEPICAGTVTAMQGPTSVPVKADQACGVYALPPGVGTYKVVVTAPGYTDAQATVEVIPTDCDWKVKDEGPRGSLPGFGSTVTVALSKS